MENFLDALTEYLSNEANIKEAESNCESSWGYWLHDQYNERERLLKACNDSFVDLVKRGIA